MTYRVADGYRRASLLDSAPTPDKVRELERHLIGLPQRDLQTTNVIHGGMCARTIFMEKDTIATGAELKIANMLIVSGDVTVTTDDGPKRLTGYHIIPSQPGFKRAAISHADSYVTCVWITALEDLHDIEDEMTDESALLQTRRDGIVYEQPQGIEVTK